MTERVLSQKDFSVFEQRGVQSSPDFSERKGRTSGSPNLVAWPRGGSRLWTHVGARRRTTSAVRQRPPPCYRKRPEMRMSYFLSSLPLWLLIAVIVVIPTALAMIAQALIRKWVGVANLVKNNEIAGFKFANVGVIYAVLLAFSVIVVWEKFNDAQTAVADEAGATAALFHFSEGKEPEALAARIALANYLEAAVDDDWPAMAHETESPAAERALDSL